jgi:hypothetical protein
VLDKGLPSAADADGSKIESAARRSLARVGFEAAMLDT